MSDQRTGSGWQPLSKPNLSPPDVSRADQSPRLNRDGSPVVSAFVRLARTHAFHAAGEASVIVALAGTLLTIDPNDARSRILLYLVLTMAPFAVVGPLIGPALDRIRGGRRATIAVSLLVRAVLMILLMRNVDSAWFFPIAFVWLVLGKTYSVAKAATVPTTVSDHDELVDKNSRLAVLTAVAGFAGGATAGGLYRLFGSSPTFAFAAIIYTVGLFMSIQLPRVAVDDPEVADDDLEIRSAGVRLASWAMATMRAIVGFVFWLLIFEFVRSDLPDLSGVGTAAGAAVKSALGFELLENPGPPRWKVAIPFALWGLGGFGGNLIAPWFRKRVTEERMILGALILTATAAIAAVWAGGLSGAALLALIVGSGPSAAKLAFDSLVQRDAPGANHGAAFGRFETRFQIAWVVGALLAVIVSFPLRAGFLVVAIAAVAMIIVTLRQGPRSVLSGRLWPSRGAADETDGPDNPDGAVEAQQPQQPEQPVPAAAPAQQQQAPIPAAHYPNPAATVTTQMAVADIAAADPSAPGPPAPGPPAPDPPAPDPSAAADPYAEAFADRPVEPPDWASSVFGTEPRPGDDPDPTPPLGTPAV